MIRVNNVVKTFGDFRALDGVNLHVRDGAIYGLVGPNGAGKSTIIRHITGIYKPGGRQHRNSRDAVYENPRQSRICIIFRMIFSISSRQMSWK